jgi:crossover junction endodeoxyribonuclease RuvC
MSIILGIDPGSCVTGYGIVQQKNKNLDLIGFGSIIPPKENCYKKHLFIFEKISELLATYKPKAVVVETPFVHKNVQSALKISSIRTIATLAAAQKKIEIFEYTPTKIKSSVVGSGHASKEQVKQMVKLQLNLSLFAATHDESDAVAIALCHAYSEKELLI